MHVGLGYGATNEALMIGVDVLVRAPALPPSGPRSRALISQCHIQDYPIFRKEPENLLFSEFEYFGADFAADITKTASDPETQRR